MSFAVPVPEFIKIPIAVLAGIGVSVLFYEGIRLPLVGQIIPGVVWYRVDAATSNMVTKFERDTLAAQLDEERRRRAISDAATARAQERADATELARQAAAAKIDELEAEARKNGLDTWTEEELQWYGRH
ncbi:hypothetical protein J2X76_003691 [Neorhizobium sp. 2083]|uniref:hypothetical protein n=1 Tax=Neorhizobium sp. 2083 TaxID=2817762 RepID=UPI0028613A50|nr:hypothetical protein [Neorhizobium sp. 2083]MDR6818514.1 hypothetical protein [Neorhizobium sp. 2083]